MKKLKLVVYLVVAIAICAAVETALVLGFSLTSIIVSILSFIPLAMIGFVMGIVAVAAFSFSKSYFTLLGRPMLVVGYHAAIVMSVFFCAAFFGVSIDKCDVPRYKNVFFIPHPSILFLGVYFGLKTGISKISERSCMRSIR